VKAFCVALKGSVLGWSPGWEDSQKGCIAPPMAGPPAARSHSLSVILLQAGSELSKSRNAKRIQSVLLFCMQDPFIAISGSNIL
jgi:hypothetical protein